MTKITIVDEKDNVIGSEEREVAKQNGLIHRIFRVIIRHSKGQLFLQKRGKEQDTWPNRWDQSVGGHVDEGEDYDSAALREMGEELGINDISLNKLDKWYQEENMGGTILKRFNVLYGANYDGEIILAKGEISGGEWFDINKIKKWMEENPDNFTPGCIDTFERYWKLKGE